LRVGFRRTTLAMTAKVERECPIAACREHIAQARSIGPPEGRLPGEHRVREDERRTERATFGRIVHHGPKDGTIGRANLELFERNARAVDLVPSVPRSFLANAPLARLSCILVTRHRASWPPPCARRGVPYVDGRRSRARLLGLAP